MQGRKGRSAHKVGGVLLVFKHHSHNINTLLPGYDTNEGVVTPTHSTYVALVSSDERIIGCPR
eukprot:4006320-Pyramimonas_sp.AAC.2